MVGSGARLGSHRDERMTASAALVIELLKRVVRQAMGGAP